MNRIALPSLLLLGACSQGIDQPSAASLDGNGHQEMQRSLDEMTLAVRLKAAEARVIDLERRVGALEATPQALDNKLLTQRLEQLEARIYALPPAGDAPTPPASKPRDANPDAATPPPPAPAPTARFNPFGL